MGKKATLYLLYWISVALTIALAVITIIAGKFNSSFPSGLLSICSLMLPVLLIVNAAVSIYWIARLRWFFLIPVLAITANYDYFGTIYRDSISHDESSLMEKLGSKNVRVATLNAGRFGSEDFKPVFKGVASYFRSMNVDIICFQEYNQSWDYGADSIKARLSYYPFSFIPKNVQGNFDVAVFSKFPILNAVYFQYKFSNYGYIRADILKDTTVLALQVEKKLLEWDTYDSDKERISDSLYIANYKHAKDSLFMFVLDSLKSNNQFNEGQVVRLFTTHLESTSVSAVRSTMGAAKERGEGIDKFSVADVVSRNLILSDSLRRRQALALIADIDKSPYNVILCGDFNDTPSSAVYKMFSGKLSDGFLQAGSGYMYTFNGLKKILRIDYIFASPSLSFVRYFSHQKPFSDHNPVVAEICFSK